MLWIGREQDPDILEPAAGLKGGEQFQRQRLGHGLDPGLDRGRLFGRKAKHLDAERSVQADDPVEKADLGVGLHEIGRLFAQVRRFGRLNRVRRPRRGVHTRQLDRRSVLHPRRGDILRQRQGLGVGRDNGDARSKDGFVARQGDRFGGSVLARLGCNGGNGMGESAQRAARRQGLGLGHDLVARRRGQQARGDRGREGAHSGGEKQGLLGAGQGG